MDDYAKKHAIISQFSTFTRAYLECLMWSSADEDGESFDIHDLHDLSVPALELVERECSEFESAYWDEIGDRPKHAGHDFALTRNGHGAGFWDGDWPEPMGDILTKACKAYGSCELYLGDDNQLHIM